MLKKNGDMIYADSDDIQTLFRDFGFDQFFLETFSGFAQKFEESPVVQQLGALPESHVHLHRVGSTKILQERDKFITYFLV